MTKTANASSSSPGAGAGLLRYRAAVASRAVAAIAGGYGLASACAAGAAMGLAAIGMSRAEAVMAATMLAFIAHAVAALWAFGCASARRAWLGIVVPGLLLGVPAWLAARGGRP